MVPVFGARLVFAVLAAFLPRGSRAAAVAACPLVGNPLTHALIVPTAYEIGASCRRIRRRLAARLARVLHQLQPRSLGFAAANLFRLRAATAHAAPILSRSSAGLVRNQRQARTVLRAAEEALPGGAPLRI
jgi:uncharacterized protein (DUF2062 family)